MATGAHIPIMRRRIWRLGIAVAIFSSFLLIFAFRFPDSFLGQVELKTVDLRFRIRGTTKPDNNIVICAIDQQAIDKIGRWPWRRSKIGELIEKIHSGHASLINVDITFSQPQVNPFIEALQEDQTLKNHPVVAEHLSRLMEKFAEDASLAKSIRTAEDVVLGYFFLMDDREADHISLEKSRVAKKLLAPFSVGVVRQKDKSVAQTILTARGAEPNIRIFSTEAKGAGYFNVFADSDGTQRHKSLIIKYDDSYYPSLELEALRVHDGLQRGQMVLELSEYGISGLQVGNRKLPVDEQGRIFLNFKGPPRTYKTVSAADVLLGKVPPETFRDKVVFLGATAPGVFDETVTPFARQGFPGVEVRATAFDDIINSRSLIMPTSIRFLDLGIILGLSLLLTFLLARYRPVLCAVFYVLLTVGFLLFSQVMFSSFRLVIATIPTFLAFTTTYIGATLIRLFMEMKIRNQIRQAFRHYLPSTIVDKISEDPDQTFLGGTEIQGSVLFCDIEGFTKLASDLSAAQTVTVLNKFLNAMTEVVLANGGTLDKFVGDALMAIWGAPLDEPKHGEKACRCALAMRDRLKRLNVEYKSKGFPEISMRVGINSGAMIAGNIGGERRFDYTVIGDAVNRGQRLEELCAKTDQAILAGEETRNTTKDTLQFHLIGEFVLIAGTEPVPVFGVSEK